MTSGWHGQPEHSSGIQTPQASIANPSFFFFPPFSGFCRDAAPAFNRAFARGLLHAGRNGARYGDPPADGARKPVTRRGRDISGNKTCAAPTGTSACAWADALA